jgi:hypothetical protein
MANEQSFADDKDEIRKKDNSGSKTKESHRGDRERSQQGGRGQDGINAAIKAVDAVVVAVVTEKTNTKKNGPSPDDDCPIHGGHLWRKCNQNPRGDNYEPARGGGRDGQGHGNPNPGRGAHGRGG